MKKLCISFAQAPLLVKGIYIALFVFLFVDFSFSQVVPVNKDSSVVFKKWEVGLYLKPLFRSDAPYNIMAKWHFTEHKALRFGLGTTGFSQANDLTNVLEQLIDSDSVKVTTNFQQMQQIIVKKTNWDFKLGFQYEFKQGKISLYSATDLNWVKDDYYYFVPVAVFQFPQSPSATFTGYQSIQGINNRKNTYGLIQSIGLKYSLNTFLSCSIESSLTLRYLDYVFSKSNEPYTINSLSQSINDVYIQRGHETQINFIPFMGLFINYHF